MSKVVEKRIAHGRVLVVENACTPNDSALKKIIMLKMREKNANVYF